MQHSPPDHGATRKVTRRCAAKCSTAPGHDAPNLTEVQWASCDPPIVFGVHCLPRLRISTSTCRASKSLGVCRYSLYYGPNIWLDRNYINQSGGQAVRFPPKAVVSVRAN